MRSHTASAIAVSVTAVLALAACSDDGSTLSGQPSSPSNAGASATSGAPDATDAPNATGTPAAAADGAYTSVISATEVDNPALDRFEADIMSRVDAVGLPGAGLLVVQDGELVQHEAWGEYELDTWVPIASGSKWLAGVTIMTVVDEGLIDLDTPIGEYLPNGDRLPGKTKSITMRMLLSFTSGLMADARIPCMTDGTVTLQECAREVLARGVVHEPGTAFRYGSQHLHVAAALAEVVTGESFQDLFLTRVAQPLGMTSTAFAQLDGSGITDVDHPLPAGSAISAMADYARFLEMLQHGGLAPDGTRIISEDAIAEMDTNRTDDVDYVFAAEWRVNTRGVYGLAHWVDWTYPDGSWMVMSSDGKFGFRPWIDRENGIYGVYLVEDRGEGFVEGDPDSSDTGVKVHTSGNWVFTDVAAALGGRLPLVLYPHRA